MTAKTILSNVDRGVMTITLNRPERLNALDIPGAEELLQTLVEGASNDEVKAVILTGAGSGFCAGGDLKAVWRFVQRDGDAREFFREITISINRAVSRIRQMEKLVLAAVNGVASGMGMSLALACDLRIGGEGARFKQGFTSRGLVPDGGWTVFLPKIIGSAKTLEMLLIDPDIDAKAALSLGLISEIVPDADLLKRTRKVAARLARGSSSSITGAKILVNEALFPDLEAQMERERQRIIFQGGTADFLEGLQAFIEKRAPRFPT